MACGRGSHAGNTDRSILAAALVAVMVLIIGILVTRIVELTDRVHLLEQQLYKQQHRPQRWWPGEGR